jgi:hypothetical protein
MVRVDGFGRYESITTFVRHDSDGMPPRLKICSIDIVYDSGYGEVIDAARRFIFWLSFQHSIRNFGSQQVVAQCDRRLFMFCRH